MLLKNVKTFRKELLIIVIRNMKKDKILKKDKLDSFINNNSLLIKTFKLGKIEFVTTNLLINLIK